ncbi:(dimethylallyl)adenosine tRNA methylthiotransferase [Bacteroidetes bacterium UKL13-3]|nr:(dimethylallyl)adenosine tRNA methylthiotransferase [Bacteroidetes bacterium UKL13-3]
MKGIVAAVAPETAKRNLYIETYGCAMNLADSEVMASIMQAEGFKTTDDPLKADVVFLNTCAIRDNAEAKIWGRLKEMKGNKRKNPGMIIGLMGCMAERLKSKLLEQDQLVDIVVGPDAYRDIPKLIQQVEEGQRAVNVLLSREETYAEITPVRLGSNGVNAFISIMRGCDNMCSFCVVPFTRGRERSREPESIIREATELFEQGYKEVTLLGQNVDSYKWDASTPLSNPTTVSTPLSNPTTVSTPLSNPTTVSNSLSNPTTVSTPLSNPTTVSNSLSNPTTVSNSLSNPTTVSNSLSNPTEHTYSNTSENVVNFAQLLEKVALISPELRVRFSSSHPKDITDEVLFTIKKYDNICNYIHYPVQSGNSRVLKMMNRTYDREWLVKRLARIREVLPDVGISTDAIVGFCSETEDEFQDTLSLFRDSQFEFAFMYAYSERPGTLAERKYEDDVTAEVKSRRLAELVALQNSISLNKKQDYIGKTYRVLIEGFSKKSNDDLKGRNDQNQLVVFPAGKGYAKGDYVNVKIERCTMTSLFGRVIVD